MVTPQGHIVERSIIKKFRKNIWSKFTQSLKHFSLVEEKDRICVCVSGGKDSMLLAKCLQELEKHGKTEFKLKFLLMDPGYDNTSLEIVFNNARTLNIPLERMESGIFQSVAHLENPCYLCARMRRGFLYSGAKKLGCNKIALGHHKDDVIETIMLNLCYAGQIKTMLPKLKSRNFENMELIRPLYYIEEEAIKAWQQYNNLTFINCACPLSDVCTIESGDGGKISKRCEMKNLLAYMESVHPGIKDNIFKSLDNVNLEAILGFRKDGKKGSFLSGY